MNGYEKAQHSQSTGRDGAANRARPVVSEVIVKTAAGTMASVITTRSVQDMKLKKGDKVVVMVKATEASIQKGGA